VPFSTKSLHEPAWHVPLQTLLAQSPAAPQGCPVAQRDEHAAPPQSIPVSSWLEMPSVHVGARQTWFAQCFPAQSLFVSQAAASRHGPHDAPPQSTSVSVPLSVPSLHPGAAQTSVGEQYPDAQSAAVMHTPPSGQSPQATPPQSVSVSVPLRTPSVHAGAWQTPPVQTWLAQSAALPQP
jgi:hypothetical protein